MKFPILTPILLLLLSSLAHTHNTSPKAIAHGTHARRALDRCSAELEAHTNSPGRLARRAELLGRTPVTNANPKAGICVLAPEAAVGGPFPLPLVQHR